MLADHVSMPPREEQARRRDEENREELAIARGERQLAAGERELERELEQFDAAENRTKAQIEHEWRAEHLGHEPQRPPAWRPAPPATGSGSKP